MRGQEATDAKSNEVAAIPLRLERLEPAGARGTIDAMGTQTAIADRSCGGAGTVCPRRGPIARRPTATSSASSPIRRPPWPIESRRLWTLDVVAHDALVRLRSGHGPGDMAVIRHCAVNLVRAADDGHSLEIRRRKANLEPAGLAKPLAHPAAST